MERSQVAKGCLSLKGVLRAHSGSRMLENSSASPGVLQVGELEPRARCAVEKPSKPVAYFDNLLLYRLALAGIIGDAQ